MEIRSRKQISVAIREVAHAYLSWDCVMITLRTVELEKPDVIVIPEKYSELRNMPHEGAFH